MRTLEQRGRRGARPRGGRRLVTGIVCLALGLALTTGGALAQWEEPPVWEPPPPVLEQACAPAISTSRFAVYPEPALPALPPAGGKFCDPTFGTEIMRVTDASDGPEGKTGYSYWPTFNLNSTRVLAVTAGGYTVFEFDPDTFTLGPKHALPPVEGGIFAPDDAIWSATDPHVLYGHLYNSRIYAYNVVTRTYALVADLAGALPPGGFLYQMSKSMDDDVFAFTRRGPGPDYAWLGYLAYRRSTNEVLYLSAEFADEVQIDKTGRHLVVRTGSQGVGAIEVKVVDLETKQVTDLTDNEPDHAPGHGDLGRGTTAGAKNYGAPEVTWRTLGDPRNFRVALDLSGEQDYGAYHVSLLADNEDWTLISFPGENANGVMSRELVQVATDGSQRVRRLLHHRSVVFFDHRFVYYDTPRANASRDGRYVAFTSNWGDSGRRDLFVAQIPPAPAAAAEVQLSASGYSAAESSQGATLTVTRTGNISGPATVDYRTIDDPAPEVRCDAVTGVALPRCDYATTVDTLSFAPGESQKNIHVPVVNDSHAEGPERFKVVLSNPSGTPLGPQFYAFVNVADDDPAPGPNPIGTHPFFVRQHYLDFLSREPEPSGFSAWVGVLNNCPDPFNQDPNSPSAGCDRTLVSSSFFRSAEFELKGSFVYLFYKAGLGRLPRYSEIVYDMRSVTGQTGEEVYAKRGRFTDVFAQRQEFRAAYDGLTNAAYVDALLGRYGLSFITTPDPQNPDTGPMVTLSRDDLAGRLNAGSLTRAQVLRALAQSQQVSGAEYNGMFVAMQYFGYLRRNPDAGGYNAWLNYLNTHPGDYRTMVNGFIYSQEYGLRFGPA